MTWSWSPVLFEHGWFLIQWKVEFMVSTGSKKTYLVHHLPMVYPNVLTSNWQFMRVSLSLSLYIYIRHSTLLLLMFQQTSPQCEDSWFPIHNNLRNLGSPHRLGFPYTGLGALGPGGPGGGRACKQQGLDGCGCDKVDLKSLEISKISTVSYCFN